MNTSSPTPLWSDEDGVLHLVKRVISNHQTELESKKSNMEKLEKTLLEIRQIRTRQDAALTWHNIELRLSEEDRGQRDAYVNTALERISRMEEECDAESLSSSRNGSFEGSQMSVSGEKHGTHPRDDRETKHRREQGEDEN